MKLAIILLVTFVAPSLASPFFEFPKFDNENPTLCFICQRLIGRAEEVLQGDENAQEITNFFDKQCERLPIWIQRTCGEIVNPWAEMIAPLVEEGQKITVESVCVERLEYCPSE